MNVKILEEKPLLNKENKAESWREYVKELYQEKVLGNHMIEKKDEVYKHEIGDSMLKQEFQKLKHLNRSNCCICMKASPIL